MADTPELKERERQILQAVVHSYITTAEPVGSRTVVKRFDLDLSPATVRNVMADLEELGYLGQLHTSSGRVPTEMGYRYYVNYLMRVQRLTVDERNRIDREFKEKLNDADEILRQTSHLLALVTHQAGLVEAPAEGDAAVQRIELMPLRTDRLAVLMVDNFGRLRTFTFDIETSVSAVELEPLNRFLNEHLYGVSTDNLAAELEQKLRNFFDEQRRLAEMALSILGRIPRNTPAQLYLDGASQLFDQPEFKDISRAREVLELFDERERLMTLLREAGAQSEGAGNTVYIGEEGSGFDGLSVVASPYEIDGKPVGMIGILGPRRMPYSRLTAVVEHTAELVGRLLTRIAH